MPLLFPNQHHLAFMFVFVLFSSLSPPLPPPPSPLPPPDLSQPFRARLDSLILTDSFQVGIFCDALIFGQGRRSPLAVTLKELQESKFLQGEL